MSESEWGRRRLRTAGPSGFPVCDGLGGIQARPEPSRSRLAPKPASEHGVKSLVPSVPFFHLTNGRQTEKLNSSRAVED